MHVTFLLLLFFYNFACSLSEVYNRLFDLQSNEDQ